MNKRWSKVMVWVVSAILMIGAADAEIPDGATPNPMWEVLGNKPFPRLFGMNIGMPKPYHDTAYQQQLAKLDAVILGFGPDWDSPRRPEKLRQIVIDLKKLNPELLVGQYTILTESYDRNTLSTTGRDKTEIIYKQQWWLRNEDGERVRRSKKFDMWDVNITHWTKPDEEGRRYPEWLAERDYQFFFKPIPELEIWYFDTVMHEPPKESADITRDRQDDDHGNPKIQAAFRQGHKAEWDRARKLKPNMLFMGNFTTNDLSFPEFKNQLNGAFLEALMGKSWSIERRQGWKAMMARYHGAVKNTLEPKMIVFSVLGKKNDYRFFRYAFTSSLLDNGYFSFSEIDKGYSSVPWFDEYDVELGAPVEPAVFNVWKNGVYRRHFEKGMVLVNPGYRSREIFLESGYFKIMDGKAAHKIILRPKDGLVLIKQINK